MTIFELRTLIQYFCIGDMHSSWLYYTTWLKKCILHKNLPFKLLEARILAEYWLDMAAILKSKIAAQLIIFSLALTHFYPENVCFHIKIDLLSHSDAEIVAKQWFYTAAILKFKRANHLGKFLLSLTHVFTHSMYSLTSILTFYDSFKPRLWNST